MTTTVTKWASVVTSMLVWVSPAARTFAEPLRPITVSVQVLTTTDTPVSDIPVLLVSSLGDVSGGASDNDGRVTIQGSVPVSDRVFGLLVSGGGDSVLSDADKNRLMGRMRVWVRAHCIQAERTIALVEGQDQYSVVLRVYECSTLTGRAVDSDGAAQIAIVANPWTLVEPEEPSNPFTVRVPRGVASCLLIGTAQAMRFLRLTANQTATDGNLGDVAVPAPIEIGVIQVTATSFDQYAISNDLREVPGVTLLSLDGSSIVGANGRSTKDSVTGVRTVQISPVSVPTGTFYVLPGIFSGEATHRAVLDAIERNDAAALSVLPSVQVQSGGTTNVTIDFTAVHRAMFNMRQPD